MFRVRAAGRCMAPSEGKCPIMPMDPDDLANRFTYHAPKPGQPEIYQEIRDAGHSLARLIDGHTPDSREKSLAITHLEQAIMWANAGIARNEP